MAGIWSSTPVWAFFYGSFIESRGAAAGGRRAGRMAGGTSDRLRHRHSTARESLAPSDRGCIYGIVAAATHDQLARVGRLRARGARRGVSALGWCWRKPLTARGVLRSATLRRAWSRARPRLITSIASVPLRGRSSWGWYIKHPAVVPDRRISVPASNGRVLLCSPPRRDLEGRDPPAGPSRSGMGDGRARENRVALGGRGRPASGWRASCSMPARTSKRRRHGAPLSLDWAATLGSSRIADSADRTRRGGAHHHRRSGARQAGSGCLTARVARRSRGRATPGRAGLARRPLAARLRPPARRCALRRRSMQPPATATRRSSSTLLERGASVDAKGVFGGTALHWAAMNGHRSTVDVLVARGASLTGRDARFDAMPEDWAREGGHGQLADALAARRLAG